MKCLCNHCSAKIELEEGVAGQAVTCPVCEQETILYDLEKQNKDYQEERATKRKEKLDKAKLLAGDTLDIASDIGTTAASFGMFAFRSTMQFIGLFVAVSLLVALLGFAYFEAGTTGILLWLILVVNVGYLREIKAAIVNQNR
jgi:hypothetical protein